MTLKHSPQLVHAYGFKSWNRRLPICGSDSVSRGARTASSSSGARAHQRLPLRNVARCPRKLARRFLTLRKLGGRSSEKRKNRNYNPVNTTTILPNLWRRYNVERFEIIPSLVGASHHFVVNTWRVEVRLPSSPTKEQRKDPNVHFDGRMFRSP